MKRRTLIHRILAACAAIASSLTLKAMTVVPNKPKYCKVKWRKLHDEEVLPGDMWACHNTDPNTPERQRAGEDYNLQMQAVHADHYGVKAKDIPRGNGDYWRAVAITEVF